MGTTRTFKTSVHPTDLALALNSIGAHLAAKLQLFSSDERTLTDELCDMFAIWTKAASDSNASGAIQIELTKLTPKDERRRGADLELELTTPAGLKRALFQAKVIEPGTFGLRNASRATSARLRRQLRDAEREVGTDATHVLLYVPAGHLDGRAWSFSTWEQSLNDVKPGLPSFLGTTVVPLVDLRSSTGGWRYRPFDRLLGDLTSTLPHISLTRVILEMAACLRGDVSTAIDPVSSNDEPLSRTRLEINLRPSDRTEWEEVQADLRTLLDMPRELGLEL